MNNNINNNNKNKLSQPTSAQADKENILDMCLSKNVFYPTSTRSFII
jgi:hypothetical protein